MMFNFSVNSTKILSSYALILPYLVIGIMIAALVHSADHAYEKLSEAEIMPARDYLLERTYIGQQETSTALIAKIITDVSSNGADTISRSLQNRFYGCYGYKQYYPAETSDDPGLYWIVPPFAHMADIEWQNAKKIFFAALALFSALVLFSGLLLISGFQRIGFFISLLCALGLTITVVTISRDVYLAYLLSLSWIPLCIWAIKNFEKKALIASCILLSACVFGGLADVIRSHSGTALILFISTLILFESIKGKKFAKYLFLIAVVLLFFWVPKGLMSLSQNHRNIVLAQHDEPVYGNKAHPLWHSLVIGLGYIQPNPFNLEYKDQKAMEIAESKNPNVCYLSNEYDDILHDAYFNFIKEEPVYVAKSFIYKGLVSSYKTLNFDDVFVFFIVLSLITLFFSPVDWGVYTAFLITISFNMLPGILVVPEQSYLTGAVTALSIFCIYIMFSFFKQNAHTQRNTTN